MPLASRINSPANAEPKTKKAKTATKKRTSGRASAAAAAKVAENINNTTSSTENDDINNINDKNSPTKNSDHDMSETKPLQTATNKINRSKSASNGIAAAAVDTKSNDVELKNDLNDTINDTVMTEVTNGHDTTISDGDILVNTKTITKPGYALSVGENLSNQLGLTLDVDGRKKPQLIKLLEAQGEIIQVAAGGMHSAVLSSDGSVYTFGCNDEFALGSVNASEDDIQKVDLPEKSIEITAGDSHCAALSETGVVYAWGTFRDGSGVVGLEQQKIAKTPMKFKLREKIAKISSGADHLVFLTVSGDVYTAGNSEHGQLGRVSKYNSFRGGRRGSDMILVPGLVRIGKKKEFNGSKKIEDIWTSSYCTYLKVKDSDAIVAFGLNNCYQLGAEDMENRYQPDLIQTLKFMAPLKKVIGGMHHTLFLDTNGRVYSMGSHRYGGLGLGRIEADVSFPTIIPNLTDIIEIAANTNTSYAIDKNGQCFSWGTNYSKQLGQDDEEDYYTPTLVKSKQVDSRKVYQASIGGQHSLFIVSEEIDKD